MHPFPLLSRFYKGPLCHRPLQYKLHYDLFILPYFFELVDKLSKVANVAVPNAVEEIKTAPVRHDKVVEIDEMVDAIQLSYGAFKNKVNIYGLAGKWASDAYGTFVKEFKDDGRLYIAGASGKLGEVNLAFNYFKNTGKSEAEDVSLKSNIYNVNASWSFLKDFTLKYDYMWADERGLAAKGDNPKVGSKDGWIAQLFYKGADPAKVGTWGLHFRYFDQPASVWLYPTYDLNNFEDYGGYEGWNIGGDVTLAKNIFLNVNYYDTESKGKVNGKKGTDRTIFSELFFLF